MRYGLLRELDRRDDECKRLLERLCGDPHPRVAKQALARYLDFVLVDRSRCRLQHLATPTFPARLLPKRGPERALVDWCLGRPTPWFEGLRCGAELLSIARPLDAAKADDRSVVAALRIVGLYGERSDAKSIAPFLVSANPYVALEAAKAAVRLGERASGVATLRELSQRDPAEHLAYVTLALHALRELDDPGIRARVLAVAAKAVRDEKIAPNRLNGVLALAAEYDPDIWDG